MNIKSIGDKFEGLNNETYFLAQTAPNRVSLINLETGNRFREAIKVESAYDISPDEWIEIIGSVGAGYFKKV